MPEVQALESGRTPQTPQLTCMAAAAAGVDGNPIISLAAAAGVSTASYKTDYDNNILYNKFGQEVPDTKQNK